MSTITHTPGDAGSASSRERTTSAERSKQRAGRTARRGIRAVIVYGLQVLLVLGLLAGGGLAAYWFNVTDGTAAKSAVVAEESSRLVETVTARRGNHPVRVRVMGTVMAAREVIIRPRVSGMITEQSASFVPGGFFTEGTFMVQLDRTDYEQTLLQRQSELAQAEAALQIELGDQAVAREELELLEVDIPDINRDLILRVPQVNRAKAEVRVADAAVQRAVLDLGRTRIVAPFDGHIVERSVTAGNNVSAGDQLATFVGDDRYWIELAVPVSSLRWIDVPGSAEDAGSRASVRDALAWGPGVVREGAVTQLLGRLERGSRLSSVIVTVPDPLGLNAARDDVPTLMLNAFVEVEIEGRELRDVIVIDRDLVREGDVVWVMGDDDRLATKPVTIAYRGQDEVYVTSGLEDGDCLVRTNLTTPVNGMLLRDASSVEPPAAAGDESEEASGG